MHVVISMEKYVHELYYQQSVANEEVNTQIIE